MDPGVQEQDPSLTQQTTSSSSLDDFIVLGFLSMPEDFKSYQYLLRHMATTVGIQAEFSAGEYA